VRTWGSSGAAAAIGQAQAVSRLARRTGCGVDEAAELLAQPMPRRRFLGVAGAGAAVAGLGAAARRPVPARTGRGAPRVIVAGAGIAGLGCAYRLWAKYGIRADIYEYNTVPGGRISTLRGYFADGQIVEQAPPAQLFSQPSDERTQRFLRRITDAGRM